MFGILRVAFRRLRSAVIFFILCGIMLLLLYNFKIQEHSTKIGLLRNVKINLSDSENNNKQRTPPSLSNDQVNMDADLHIVRKTSSNCSSDTDRILDQLHLIPENYANASSNRKLILIWSGLVDGEMEGMSIFQERDHCKVSNCFATGDQSQLVLADAVVFKDNFRDLPKKPPNQIWIFSSLESPYNSPSAKNLGPIFNWTSTYRRDSKIVSPYGKFVPFYPPIMQQPLRNYALGRTKQVVWFVSNCHSSNGRMEYAQELSQYIDVDIIGSCGPIKCARDNSKACFDMINKKYKFYLSFENSNCKDYITEKFFDNGLRQDVIPIVMGAHPDDYSRIAPPHSFISVDSFASPQELAEYLHMIDRNDTLYNEYFRWKGSGEFINTYWWCRVCALLHEKQETQIIEDLEKWWRGEGICIRKDSWRNHGYRPNSTSC